MGNVSVQEIAERIVVLRGMRVMVDSELALLYRVTTKRLNEQVKRNRDRFPDDFMFQLNAKERDVMWSQIATTLQRSGSALATHETAILKLLAEIRQLTRFPEPTHRGIGFTADLEKGKPR